MKVEDVVDKKSVEQLSKEVEHYNDMVKNNLFTWKVYDCDEALVNDVIAISRLYFKNKGVDFLRWAVSAFKAKDNPDNFEEMFGVILLELQKISQTKEKTEPVEKADSGIKTFGGSV